jgi:undecaprenyl-diphosphatase
MDIITIIKTIVLGIVEGITEFLPISSTGHMIIVEHFMKLSKHTSFVVAFEVIIQLGAILAVVCYYWHTLWPFSGTRQEKIDKWLLWSKVLIALIPAAIFGSLFDDLITEKLFNVYVVSAALIFYGLVLIAMEVYHKKKSDFPVNSVVQISYAAALLIGFFQCLAMVPGTSRSAATIIGGMVLGLSRGVAAQFSFFLAIPTMAGATLVTLYKEGISFSASEWAIIAIGFVVSFVMAYIAIAWLMEYIKKHDFKLFGYYRIVLGIVVLLLLFL